MKKTLLTLTTALFTAQGINAQITLNSSSFTSTFAGTTDTLLTSGSGVSYPSLLASAGANWDMSTAVLATPVTYGYNVAALTSAFPSAQFADSVSLSFTTYSYIANIEKGFVTAGYQQFGEHINRQAFHPAITGGSTSDSIVFNAQNMVYSSPYTLVGFPATYNSHWSSSFSDSLTFSLTVSVAGYNHTPATLKAAVTETDTVVGWGEMKVKEVSGSPSKYMLVLQIRKRNVAIDSFFINGAVPAALVLTTLGITEGQRAGTYTEEFYRPNECRPLAAITFTDSTFTTPASARTLAENYGTDLSTGIKTITGNSSIIVYPNPVTTGAFTINVPDAQDGNWSYELFNNSGAEITNGNLAFAGGQTSAQVSVSEKMAAGNYYIVVKNNGNMIAVKTLTIIE
jgi:hypothetical protein